MSRRKNLADDLASRRAQKTFAPQDDFFTSDYESFRDTPTKGGSSTKSSSTKSYSYEPCYKTHPPLLMPGTSKAIYGGNCGSPVVKDADVYVALDRHSFRPSARSWPWKKGTEFLFDIPDMGVPQYPEEFVKLANWLKVQIDADKKVHIGCIGGHGRTGMVLAAVVSLYGEADAITYVRTHYCKKAVESKVQVTLLAKQFGITPVQSSKDDVYEYKGSSKGSSGSTVSTGTKSILDPRATSYLPLAGNTFSIWS